MTDLHLNGMDIDLLEDGIVKDILIATQDDVYFPDLVVGLVQQLDELQKSVAAGVSAPLEENVGRTGATPLINGDIA